MQSKGLMTQGNIYKNIIFFSIPLLLGNFFQLMYNTIDSIVVGNFVGATALASVGASGPIIDFMIAAFMGLASGSGVVVGRFYGARRIEEESKAIHTFIVFSFWMGVILSILGYLIAPMALAWIKTPADTMVQAQQYLRIYFFGSVFVTIYNSCTGILQSVGDSKSPLYFLMISSICNIFLDLFFVVFLKMGVAGAAIATVICQGIAMCCVLFVLKTTKQEYRLYFSKLKIDFPIMKQIITIGVPSGLQGMIVSISNVVVMSYITGFGSVGVAGFGSANKFNSFLGMPTNSFALAATTFISQNLGAKQYQRVIQGIKASLVLSISTVVMMGMIVFFNAPACIGFFSQDPGVIEAGSLCIQAMCPFYLSLCFHMVFSGALRASGRSVIPMMVSICSFVFVRQLFLAMALPSYHSIVLIGLSYSFTWTLAAILTSLYFFMSGWLKKEENHPSLA